MRRYSRNTTERKPRENTNNNKITTVRSPKWKIVVVRHFSAICCYFSLENWFEKLQYQPSTSLKSEKKELYAEDYNTLYSRRFMSIEWSNAIISRLQLTVPVTEFSTHKHKERKERKKQNDCDCRKLFLKKRKKEISKAKANLFHKK